MIQTVGTCFHEKGQLSRLEWKRLGRGGADGIANTLGDVDGSVGFGVVVVIWHVSFLLKSASFGPYPRACSGLSDAIQMKELRRHGGTDGGVFKMRGSTLEAQDE